MRRSLIILIGLASAIVQVPRLSAHESHCLNDSSCCKRIPGDPHAEPELRHAHCEGLGDWKVCHANGIGTQGILTNPCNPSPLSRNEECGALESAVLRQSPAAPGRMASSAPARAVHTKAPAQVSGERGDEVNTGNRPEVRVLTPSNGEGFVSTEAGGEVFVAIEIIDSSGSGIVMDNSGTPRFLDDHPNTRLFLKYLVANHSYSDSSNRTVFQLVSEIPVAKLAAEKNWKLTPPIDRQKLPPAWKGAKISIPKEAVIDFAAFYFRVKDGRGVASRDKRPDFPTVVIGFASEAYVPPGDPPLGPSPEEDSTAQSPTKS